MMPLACLALLFGPSPAAAPAAPANFSTLWLETPVYAQVAGETPLASPTETQAEGYQKWTRFERGGRLLQFTNVPTQPGFPQTLPLATGVVAPEVIQVESGKLPAKAVKQFKFLEGTSAAFKRQAEFTRAERLPLPSRQVTVPPGSYVEVGMNNLVVRERENRKVGGKMYFRHRITRTPLPFVSGAVITVGQRWDAATGEVTGSAVDSRKDLIVLSADLLSTSSPQDLSEGLPLGSLNDAQRRRLEPWLLTDAPMLQDRLRLTVDLSMTVHAPNGKRFVLRVPSGTDRVSSTLREGAAKQGERQQTLARYLSRTGADPEVARFFLSPRPETTDRAALNALVRRTQPVDGPEAWQKFLDTPDALNAATVELNANFRLVTTDAETGFPKWTIGF